MDQVFLTFPKSIQSHTYIFKLNTDDYPTRERVGKIMRHLRRKGISFKKDAVYYSKRKLMGWHTFRIEADKPIASFQENIDYCNSLFKDFNENL